MSLFIHVRLSLIPAQYIRIIQKNNNESLNDKHSIYYTKCQYGVSKFSSLVYAHYIYRNVEALFFCLNYCRNNKTRVKQNS